MKRWIVLVAALAMALGGAGPGRADIPVASVEVLRPLFSRLLGNPPVLEMDVVPDLYEGGYARVSLYARQADIKGMRVDELWIRLVGVSFDPALLRQGALKVLSLRDSAIYGKLSLASVEEFLNHEKVVRDVRLRLDGESVVGVATVLYNGVPTRVRMQGVFQVYGEPEVYFHIQALLVNWIPVPYVVVDRLERQINPVLDLRSWPVAFPLRTFRQTPSGFILSSQRDLSQPCAACGGPLLQLRP